MVGFALALAGGALRGYGEGKMQGIKATREEKLRQLELDRAERIEGQRMAFQREEGALNRASQEKLTNAQLSVQKSLGELQAGTQKSIAELQADTTKEVAAAGEEGANARTQAQIEANKVLQDMQSEAAQKLGIKPVTTTVTDDNGKQTSVVRMQRPDGTFLPQAVDPDTNKPISIAISGNDTNEMSNFKFLMSVGVDQGTAQQLAFSSKNADPNLMKASLIETFVKSQSTFKNADEETVANAEKWATSIMEGMGVETPTKGAPGSDAASTAPDSAATTTIKFPPGTTDAQAIAWAKAQIAAGKSKAAIKEVLKANKVDPAGAGL
jgi:DNA polymerase II small subunit/DNA polymerase delta subunit B